MTYPYRSEFAEQLRAEGRAEAVADAVLLVLTAREVVVPEKARQRIRACRDVPLLRAWLGRALNAGTVEELFA